MDDLTAAVLTQINSGIRPELSELRYQLVERTGAPLADGDVDDVVDFLAELEHRGLVELELCARLTDEGKRVLAGPEEEPRAELDETSGSIVDVPLPGPDRIPAKPNTPLLGRGRGRSRRSIGE